MRNIDTKVTFNGETRHFDFNGTFQTLYQQVALVFGIERFVLKYRDEEGDLVTMATDAELQHAHASGNPLDVEVFLPNATPVAPPAVGQQPFPQQLVYGHPSPQPQPFVATPQSAPALYPAVQQYPMHGFQQPFAQQPVYGQHPFPQQPIYSQPFPQQPVYGQPSPQPVYPAELTGGDLEQHKAVEKVDKSQRKLEKMNDKLQKKADKAQRKADKRDEKSQKKVAKLQAQVAATPAVQLADVNVAVVPQTPVFPSAPQAVWTKTPSGVFYSLAEPRPPGFEIPYSGVAPPVPYFYSIEFLDQAKRVLMPGDHFIQRWRVRNEGSYAWPAGMMLVYDPCPKHGAAFFNGPSFLTVDHALGPREEAVLSFRLVVPPVPGRYVGLWRMCTPDLLKFGKKIKIVVKAPTPENAERAIQKAIRKANLSYDERRALKVAKKAAKADAKKLYKEAKTIAKQNGDKDARLAAKLACRDAKRQAKEDHKAAKVARKAQIASVARVTVSASAGAIVRANC